MADFECMGSGYAESFGRYRTKFLSLQQASKTLVPSIGGYESESGGRQTQWLTGSGWWDRICFWLGLYRLSTPSKCPHACLYRKFDSRKTKSFSWTAPRYASHSMLECSPGMVYRSKHQRHIPSNHALLDIFMLSLRYQAGWFSNDLVFYPC